MNKAFESFMAPQLNQFSTYRQQLGYEPDGIRLFSCYRGQPKTQPIHPYFDVLPFWAAITSFSLHEVRFYLIDQIFRAEPVQGEHFIESPTIIASSGIQPAGFKIKS